MAKTVKLKIVRPLNIDWKTFNNIMNELDYNAFKIKNRATTRLHMLKMAELEYNAVNNKMNAEIRKEIYGYSTYESLIYNEIKDDYSDLGFHSEIIPGLIREAGQSYNKLLKDILKGNATLPTYKRNQPVPIRSRMIKLIDQNTMQINIINTTGAEIYGVKNIGRSVPIQLQIASKKGHANIAISRLLNKRYILCDSKLYKDHKDIYILLSFKDTIIKEVAISKDKVLGVFLGVDNAVTMHVSNTKIINKLPGGEIEAFRKRVEKQRVSKRNQLRIASHNRRGHGKNTLLSPLETLSDKVSNFKNLTNHRYSKYIVDFAVKNGCGVIVMEDLKGIRQENKLLSTWSYFDLQKKIIYKAEDFGIEIVFKKKGTNEECSKCGHISENNIKDGNFICSKCSYKEEVDINSVKLLSQYY